MDPNADLATTTVACPHAALREGRGLGAMPPLLERERERERRW